MLQASVCLSEEFLSVQCYVPKLAIVKRRVCPQIAVLPLSMNHMIAAGNERWDTCNREGL